MMQKFNINDNVKVKLTSLGYELHRKHWIAYSSENYIPPYRDIDGYSEFQLWELMSIFGHYLYNGAKTPFETEILIDLGL